MRTGVDISLNNTYSWNLGPRARLWEGIPPRAYGAADPVPEWNAWYMAPGWMAGDRAIEDQYVKFRRYLPQVGVNPWDHVFGPIGADAGLRAGAARYLASQEGATSFI